MIKSRSRIVLKYKAADLWSSWRFWGTVAKRYLIIIAIICVSGCTMMHDGPSTRAIQNVALTHNNSIQIINVDEQVTHQLAKHRRTVLFSEVFRMKRSHYTVGAGDSLEISIWEAPPATLFSVLPLYQTGTVSGSAITLLPQIVTDKGMLTVPFAGDVHVAGLTLAQIQQKIVTRLRGKAHHPQVIVRITQNVSGAVTMTGEVGTSMQLPLMPNRERLLDALASVNGVKTPIQKTVIQVTRSRKIYSLPLQTILDDPLQNILLRPGDVVAAISQTNSFTVLGATGRVEEMPFEAQGIKLAQALGRMGGLLDQRADAGGVFIFRFESATALDWPKKIGKKLGGSVPVIYQINLRDPKSFFVAQNFAIKNRDVLYVSNASAVEIQKFLSLLGLTSGSMIPAVSSGVLLTG